MAKTLTPEESFYTARAIARERAPYLQAALLMLIPREAKGLGTFGVTEEGFLLIDYDVFVQGAIPGMKAWTPEQAAGVLIHEVNHFLREHSDRTRAAHTEPWLANLAWDCEINDDLITEDWQLTDQNGRVVETKKKWDLPGDFCLPSKYELKDGLTGEEYYQLLRQKLPKQGQPGPGQPGQSGQGQGAGQGQSQPTQSGKSGNGSTAPTKPDKPCAAGGWCGSMAGHELPNEPNEGKSKQSDPKANPQGEPAKPEPQEGRTPAELERIREQVARDIEKHIKQKGSCPAGLSRWAATKLTPPKVAWQTKLARGVRSGRGMAKGMADYSWRRPSRRQGAIGYGEGKPILPALIAPKPVVCVLMDTSGSMSDNELARGLSECHGILRAVEAEVHFIVCDAAVHGIKSVKTWQEAARMLKGGGGSSFIPAFLEIERLKPRPQIVVAVTDGMIDVPDRPPHGMKVIWLLTGAGCHAPSQWGERITIER